MAEFPTSIFEQREFENLPGIEFDDTESKIVFAEDMNALGDEISAIESYLLSGAVGAPLRKLLSNLTLLDTSCLIVSTYFDDDGFDVILEGDADLLII